MNRKPRVAVIGLKGLPAYGGAAAVGENIVDRLKSQYDFTVLSVSSHTSLKSGNKLGFYQKVFKRIPNRRLNTLFYYIQSAIYVIFNKFDLVHLHHRDAAFLIPLIKWKQPVLLTTHGIFSINDEWKKFHFYFKFQERYFVKKASYITCVSKNEKRLFKTKLGIDVHYIPNGINKFKHDNLINTIRSNYILFAAGRIIYLKGCDLFLKALRKMNYQGKVVIAGNIDIDNTVKNEILNLSDGLDCVFVGLVKDRKEMNSIIQNSSLFVFPSRRETMSMMLLEVASLKIPLIVSDIIQNKDIFDDKEVIYFKSEDVDDLADKIQFALENINNLHNYTDSAYEKLISQYDWDRIAFEYSKVYNKLIKP